MNLLKAQDLLKGVPDQKLTEMLQSPQGDVPQYLVAAEAARRAKMRKEFQEDQTKPPQTTVTQDLLNELGVASLKPPGMPQPGQQQPQMPMPQMPAAPQGPVQMAEGGIVAFANGGYTDVSAYNPSYASNIQIPQLPGFDEFMGQVKTEFGESPLPSYREELGGEREKLQAQSPEKMADFLKYIGRGLAASQRTNALGAIAEGVTTGLTMQEQALQKNKEAQRLLRQSEIELAQKERAEKMGIFGLAKQLENSAAERRNSAINQSYQAQQLALTAKHYEGAESDAAARRKLEERRLGILGQQESRGAELDKLRRQKIEKEIELLGKPKPVGIDKLIAARTKLDESQMAQNKLRALMGMYGIKQLGKDPVKDALVEAAYNKWLDSQIPQTQGVYSGFED